MSAWRRFQFKLVAAHLDRHRTVGCARRCGKTPANWWLEENQEPINLGGNSNERLVPKVGLEPT